MIASRLRIPFGLWMPRVLARCSLRTIGYGQRLRLSALAVGIIIPAFFGHTLWSHRTLEFIDAEREVANTALTLKHHAARTIEITDERLQIVTSLVALHARDLGSEAMHIALRNQLARSHDLGNIVVTDRDGRAVAEAAVFPVRPLNMHERDYFQKLRGQIDDSLAIGRPIIGSLSGKPMLPIARRLVGPDGAFIGMVQAMLDIASFQAVYDAVDNEPGAILSLWRADGTLLARSPHAAETIGRNFAASDNYRHHAATGDTKPFWATGLTSGNERVIAHGFVEGYPLYVAASLSKDEVLTPWRRLALTQGILGGGLVLVLVSTLLLLARETERRQVANTRIRLLADNATDILVIGDLDLRPDYISPAVQTILGYEPEDLLGRGMIDIIHPEDRMIVAAHWVQTKAGENPGPCSVRHLHKDGQFVWMEASVSFVTDPKNGRATGAIVTLRDVTIRRKAEEQMRHMALHDALTGLPNRTLLHDRLNQAIAYADRTQSTFAVMACDLDRFKAINDSLGHPAGDALLRVVAERMQAVLRSYDTVARLGGDEFAIVLPHLAEPCSANAIANRLIAAVSEPIDLDGHKVEIGVSIGFTVCTGGDVGADELFKRADIALYEAKAAGRSTSREFCAEAGARIATHGQLGLDMKEAIRRGEFRLVYQPVVQADTGTVVAFEALMRWRHPVRGEISPAVFIPVAEETGLIVPLGVWALQEACREAMHWPAHVRVAVNVSAVQLRREGLETAVLAALAASGLSPNRLKLEVTESVLMQDADAALACLHRLRGLGVLIALDDFGTGYSSLSYLRRFPFDRLKIDRAFIRDIADPDAAAIVRAVVSLGERLGMGIVAEGVETAEQLDLVRQEGCHEVQGFLFSRPLPADEALAYLQLPSALVAA
ncbi:EAL domain-containing protein [Methylobacterium sp. WL30]|uniref:bifunctional diguanylate cyclase/phosphodiesterase n=1 Tax=unclassified Methylobacterium TaxID=2615210 RepID=UPI0011CC27D4|nr:MULTISPECIES: EAL domain-containing protein [unclassified Methylobacterium]TXM94905.1 EAL domain-containing protein [Methylobacterium sp. WL116]TXN39340.1 EAL domain-containing protein [Methylobacterium sp. WL93]TXN45795.1 EAL domain-containing protein [Methylobacterium sp. WL119]TXN62172.1 EAL domain-containing protein [Methylobacterium sp. WL30]